MPQDPDGDTPELKDVQPGGKNETSSAFGRCFLVALLAPILGFFLLADFTNFEAETKAGVFMIMQLGAFGANLSFAVNTSVGTPGQRFLLIAGPLCLHLPLTLFFWFGLGVMRGG